MRRQVAFHRLSALITVVLSLGLAACSNTTTEPTSEGPDTVVIEELVEVEQGGFRFVDSGQILDAEVGDTVQFPNGLSVQVSDLQERDDPSPDVGEKDFRYRVKFTNDSDANLTTQFFTYTVLVGADGIPCTRFSSTGPDEPILPPEVVLRPGRSASGWVGAGCPSEVSSDDEFVIQLHQHESLIESVDFVGTPS